ncbi:hypothetical protein AAW02_11080 [Aeromonas dhakensis]|uniref:hypothetical protein n=1 Tax=Aeromonas dhakensis TaxID=196024 RepID=UPI000C0C0715|nr:hypothetical protein [Aeromonas dhakensis]PHS84285.1 hypothetical protein AAW03_17805 [Aeromonas dhakensis]PHS88420.1 hypothetical protein AAW02_11080 [Aeromonas dhakensis]
MIIKGDIQGAGGVEFATFRLKEGVTEADLLALAHRVESEFLVQQSELIVHCLLRGADGIYADLVMAPSQSLVEAYCQQWLHNAVAGEYLTLLDLDSVSMSFWTRIG